MELRKNWFWYLLLNIFIPYFVVKTFLHQNASDQLWGAYWTVFNNLVLIETLVSLLVYTYETYLLRKLAIDESRKTLIPILVNILNEDKSFSIKNVGNGPALNVGCVIWDGKKLKSIHPQHMAGAIPKDGVFRYQINNFEEIDTSAYKVKMPQYYDVLKRLIDKKSGFMLLTYRDVVGVKFHSVHYTDNTITFDSAYDFGLVD